MGAFHHVEASATTLGAIRLFRLAGEAAPKARTREGGMKRYPCTAEPTCPHPTLSRERERGKTRGFA
jgi:hypothetical protein